MSTYLAPRSYASLSRPRARRPPCRGTRSRRRSGRAGGSRRSRRAARRGGRSSLERSRIGRTLSCSAMRLNAFLARAGVASRRKADELIKAGRVRVNGEPGELNTFVEPGDGRARRRRAGRAAAARATCSCTSRRASSRPRATRRGGRRSSSSSSTSPASCRSGGSTSTRPARSCSRTTARSRTGSRIRATASRRSTRSRPGASRPTTCCAGSPRGSSSRTASPRPRACRRLGAARFELVLHEGRNRQVRRMCEAVGHRVRRLHRSVYAGLGVERARPGRVAGARRGRGPRRSLVEREHRQDHVQRDERQPLERAPPRRRR